MTKTDPMDLLYQELDEWNFEGEEAMLWWRDDDAVADSEALQALIRIASTFDAPLSLAVIPAGLEESLVSAVDGSTLVTVLQHGIAHQNLAPANAKKQELTMHANQSSLETALCDGFATLSSRFGERFCPVLVPPWNRIDPEVTVKLPAMGFMGLSSFASRSQPTAGENLWQINTHADVINWKEGRRFAGDSTAVRQIVDHLSARRLGRADRAEPTGILTHHLVHDRETWAFLERLFNALDQHPAATLLSAERVFQTRWR